MKKIIFSPVSDFFDGVIENPKPSIKDLPQWYKKTSLKLDNSCPHSKIPISNTSNLTVRSCMPVFDSISAGYMLYLPCDVEFVDPKKYGFRVFWDVNWKVVSEHSETQIGEMVLPKEYDRSPLKWEGVWNIKVPNGYSLLFTHPFYRYDLPFISGTGIVDSDSYHIAIHIPFFIKKDFYGVIEKGTPIAQIIPIKRENWKSYIKESDNLEEKRLNILKTKITKSYKKQWWQRKKYE